jgi:NAD(P)-dependent dehydrogenase (short-subunit alcohol dehydrogenase family)
VAAAKIRNQTNNPNVTFDEVDLSDFKSIENFAKRVNKCHILVNNAGEILKDKTFIHGVERTMLTNYVGSWYLTKLLLPKLAQTSIEEQREVRVVNVCSRAEKYSNLGPDYLVNKGQAFDNLFKGPEPHQPFLAYSNYVICYFHLN